MKKVKKYVFKVWKVIFYLEDLKKDNCEQFWIEFIYSGLQAFILIKDVKRIDEMDEGRDI